MMYSALGEILDWKTGQFEKLSGQGKRKY